MIGAGYRVGCEGNVVGRAGVESGVPRFGPRRIAAFHALWQAVTLSRRPGAPTLGDRLRALPRMVTGALTGRYPDLGRGRLALFLLAVAYLVSPVDLVPEGLLGLIGLGDDAVVALWLSGAFLAETERFLGWERTRPMVVDQPPTR
jgi:uncharacterized membrane protein YkvA (DUF1232 family)